MFKTHSLVLDVGTSGVKAFVFDWQLRIVSRSYLTLKKKVFGNRVEQDPMELLTKSITVLRKAVQESGVRHNAFSGLGITNQRETVIVWDSKTGKPVYPAIVWEDSRTAKQARSLNIRFGRTVLQKTGLPIIPYFSATKIHWILNHVPAVKKLLSAQRLKCGTVDSWILWNLTQGRVHATDYTNAGRTLLFNLRKLSWDIELLKIFSVPKEILPKALPSRSQFGVLKSSVLGFSIPVRGICGDQQASSFAAGIKKGTTKVTYGTGIFITQILGEKFLLQKPFFTTLVPGARKPVYALEAKIGDCGKRVEKLLHNSQALRVLVQKFAAAVAAYVQQLPHRPRHIVVDGGVTQYPDLPSIQEAALGIKVRRQRIADGTALGVAKLIKS